MKKVFAAIGIIILDQVSKFIVLKHWPQIVSSNNGGAFSVFQNYRFYSLIVLVLIILLIAAMIFLKNVRVWPVFLIIAGALSNLIDRLARLSVIDFINLKFFSSFNLADVAISVGLVWIVLEAVGIIKKSPR